jgi:hypothetical protein
MAAKREISGDKNPAFQGNAVHLSGAALPSLAWKALEGLGRCRRDSLYGDVLEEGAQEPAYATATGR